MSTSRRLRIMGKQIQERRTRIAKMHKLIRDLCKQNNGKFPRKALVAIYCTTIAGVRPFKANEYVDLLVEAYKDIREDIDNSIYVVALQEQMAKA